MRNVYEVYIIDPETDDWWKLAPVIAKDISSAKIKAFLKAQDYQGNPRLTKDIDAYTALVTTVGQIADGPLLAHAPNPTIASSALPEIRIGNS